ncbi:MAG TPA: hypothetical protein VIG47_06615, partial [Gemmatimonadaceae bacterium]
MFGNIASDTCRPASPSTEPEIVVLDWLSQTLGLPTGWVEGEPGWATVAPRRSRANARRGGIHAADPTDSSPVASCHRDYLTTAGSRQEAPVSVAG